MSHTTPATYLVWSILSSLLGCFLVFHLWKFDKFKCLKWNNGPYTGAFKRLMTYTYLLSVPGIITYSMGFAVIKYQEGFVDLPLYGIIPKPWQMWTPVHQSAILPFYLLFTISWSLEMVTHLEELCFWLFLVNAGSVQQDWFRSLYFKTWIAGSLVAITYMPLVTILTRADPLKCEAFTFLAGSLGSMSLTLWFLPILRTFPDFINNLKRNGVDTRTIVRLSTFHELNCLRVFFRFLMVLPLLILAIDGVRPHQHVNESPFWTEFLTSIAAVGCVISSAMTLVIFFPRSVESEVQSRHATREKSQTQSRTTRRMSQDTYTPPAQPQSNDNAKRYSSEAGSPISERPLKRISLDLLEQEEVTSLSPVFTPNRRLGAGVVIEGHVRASPTRLTARALAAHNQSMENVHPFLHNFTSPIDIMEGPRQPYGRRHKLSAV